MFCQLIPSVMDGMQVLSFWQRLSVLNDLFTTRPKSGRLQNGERFVQRHLKGVTVSVTPLLNLRFADSGT